MKGEIKVATKEGTIYQANIWVLLMSYILLGGLHIDSRMIKIFIDETEIPRPCFLDYEK